MSRTSTRGASQHQKGGGLNEGHQQPIAFEYSPQCDIFITGQTCSHANLRLTKVLALGKYFLQLKRRLGKRRGLSMIWTFKMFNANTNTSGDTLWPRFGKRMVLVANTGSYSPEVQQQGHSVVIRAWKYIQPRFLQCATKFSILSRRNVTLRNIAFLSNANLCSYSCDVKLFRV